MSEQIHGHSVMQMISESDQALSRDELFASMRAQFGEQAQYRTCSAGGMNAEQIVELLLSKSKLVQDAEGISVNYARTCCGSH